MRYLARVMSLATQVRLRCGARRVALESRSAGHALTISLALSGMFVAYTWLVVRWQPLIDLDASLNRNFHVHHWWPVLHVSDRIGQRAVCLPVLVATIGYTGWRRRSWRPALLAAFGVFVVNLVVLVAKVAMSRDAPLSGQSFFGGGDVYPSGHTANVALVFGLCYYLLTQHGQVARLAQRVLVGLLAVIASVMFATSLLLRWHWFSDLVGGFLIGGAVLALTVAVDSAFEAPTPAPRLSAVSAIVGRFRAQ